MSPRKTKDHGGTWLIGRGAFLGTSIVAVVLGAVLITLGWSSGHDRVPPVVVQTTPPPTTGQPTTSVPGTTAPPVIIASGTSIGSPSAPLTVVEYSDFQCPFCQRFADTLEAQFEADYVQTGKVRFVYKYLVAYGSDSLLAAEAAQAAAQQNQFWPYHDALMQLHLNESVPDFSVAKAQSIAQQLGLNMAAFSSNLTSDQVKATVMQDDAEGRATGITGIPAFFFNGVKQPDSVSASYDSFKSALDAALAKAGG